jgi:hypothetical protein
MEHWGFTDEVKQAAKKGRRLQSKTITRQGKIEGDETGDRLNRKSMG